MSHPVFHSRADVIEHLESRAHIWKGLRSSVYDGSLSPDPLGWHDQEGSYLVPTSELLAVHRELHAELDR